LTDRGITTRIILKWILNESDMREEAGFVLFMISTSGWSWYT